MVNDNGNSSNFNTYHVSSGIDPNNGLGSRTTLQIINKSISQKNYRDSNNLNKRKNYDNKLQFLRDAVIDYVKIWPADKKLALMSAYGSPYYNPNIANDENVLNERLAEILITDLPDTELDKIKFQVEARKKELVSEVKKVESQTKEIQKVYNKQIQIETKVRTTFIATYNQRLKILANSSSISSNSFFTDKKIVKANDMKKFIPTKYRRQLGNLANEIKVILNKLYTNNADFLKAAKTFDIQILEKGVSKSIIINTIANKVVLYVAMMLEPKNVIYPGITDPEPYNDILQYTSYSFLTGRPRPDLGVLEEKAKLMRLQLQQQIRMNRNLKKQLRKEKVKAFFSNPFTRKRYRKDKGYEDLRKLKRSELLRIYNAIGGAKDTSIMSDEDIRADIIYIRKATSTDVQREINKYSKKLNIQNDTDKEAYESKKEKIKNKKHKNFFDNLFLTRSARYENSIQREDKIIKNFNDNFLEGQKDVTYSKEYENYKYIDFQYSADSVTAGGDTSIISSGTDVFRATPTVLLNPLSIVHPIKEYYSLTFAKPIGEITKKIKNINSLLISKLNKNDKYSAYIDSNITLDATDYIQPVYVMNKLIGTHTYLNTKNKWIQSIFDYMRSNNGILSSGINRVLDKLTNYYQLLSSASANTNNTLVNSSTDQDLKLNNTLSSPVERIIEVDPTPMNIAEDVTDNSGKILKGSNYSQVHAPTGKGARIKTVDEAKGIAPFQYNKEMKALIKDHIFEEASGTYHYIAPAVIVGNAGYSLSLSDIDEGQLNPEIDLGDISMANHVQPVLVVNKSESITEFLKESLEKLGSGALSAIGIPPKVSEIIMKAAKKFLHTGGVTPRFANGTKFISGDSRTSSPNPELVSIDWDNKQFAVKPIPNEPLRRSNTNITKDPSIKKMTPIERSSLMLTKLSSNLVTYNRNLQGISNETDKQALKVYIVNPTITDIIEVDGEKVSMIGLVNTIKKTLDGILASNATTNTQLEDIKKINSVVKPAEISNSGSRNPFISNDFSDLDDILIGK